MASPRRRCVGVAGLRPARGRAPSTPRRDRGAQDRTLAEFGLRRARRASRRAPCPGRAGCRSRRPGSTSRSRWRSPAKGMRLKAASVSKTPSPSVRPRSSGSMRPRAAPSIQTGVARSSQRSGRGMRQQGVAVLGQHRFRMELHAEGRMRAVAERHHLAVLAPGAGLELGRILAGGHDQRMVAADLECLGGRPANRPVPSCRMVEARPCIGVPARVTVGAKSLADALMAEADAEDRHHARRGGAPPRWRRRPRSACTARAR